MPCTPTSETSVVAGIDVGGHTKGFHGVALRSGKYLASHAACSPESMVDWCREVGARIVAIDAPCRWSLSGRARPAERALAAERIYSFATPDRERGEKRGFYRWMLNGAALYKLMEPHYPLFDGKIVSNPLCCETFPQAVACSLSGKIVKAKLKQILRPELVKKAGIDTTALTTIDMVDAALCAIAAHHLLMGNIRVYGEIHEGFIVVPG